jgi:hypothetical protein
MHPLKGTELTIQPNPDVSEVLDRQRIAAAYATLTDQHDTDGHVDLDDAERKVISDALQRSPHPLGGFARTLLDEWDHLDVDDQVAGLLLFAEITRHPTGRRTPGLELGR